MYTEKEYEKHYLLGLDNGGTRIKAVLFDTEGHEISGSSARTPTENPAPGFVERDMNDLYTANQRCIRETIQASGIDAKQIAAIAISGHGKGLYAWGKDGQAAYRGIGSSDNRAWCYTERWKKDGTFERNYPKLCQNLVPSQQLALLAWLKDEKPDIYRKIRWVFPVKDYLRFRLTGEAYCEATDISGSGLFSLRDGCYDREMLQDFGIEEIAECLAPIRYSADLCGRITREAAAVTGLSEGTPVSGGLFDIDACAVAMHVLSEQDLITIAGTWSINEYISKTPVLALDPPLMNSLFAIPTYYLIEDSSATSAGNLEWFIDEFFADSTRPDQDSIYSELEKELVKSDSSSPILIFLPFLFASNTHPVGKAAFIGLTANSSKTEMLRAMYEGVAFSHRMHVERLLSTRKVPDAIRLAGGVCKSEFWVQLFADVLGMKVETFDVTELGTLGAAMTAGVTAGLFRDFEEAALHMSHFKSTAYPDPLKTKIYDRKYAVYKKCCEALNPVWPEMVV